MKWGKEHIWFADNYVNVKGLGTVGLWWKYYDKKVAISYGFGKSFYANTEEEIIEEILKRLNYQPKNPPANQ